eukprot:scaffold14631_cov47-Cyclotella_meneghiniana.AAC.2
MMQPATPKSRQSEPTSSDETMERISLHCHENSPILSQLSCVNCQSLNIECLTLLVCICAILAE